MTICLGVALDMFVVVELVENCCAMGRPLATRMGKGRPLATTWRESIGDKNGKRSAVGDHLAWRESWCKIIARISAVGENLNEY